MRVALVGAECEENLAIRYLEGALRAAGHETVIIPFNSSDDLEVAARELADSRAELAGLSMVFTYRAHEFATLAVQARRSGFTGHLVAGGHFAAFHARQLLTDVPAINSVAIGEGERIMCDLAEHLEELCVVPGLVWMDGHAGVVENGPALKPPDLDALPFPTHKEPPDCFLGLPIANILSSRGCTHDCYFCSISAWHRLCGGKRVRMRSPGDIAAEMSLLYSQGYRIFNFHDDNFILKSTHGALERIKVLQKELTRRGVGRIAFAIKSRPGSVDEELFACMKRMGLFRVFVGIEAGTDESLERLGRRQSVAQNQNALRILNELDLHACFNLLMFNPDSTLEDVRSNVAFLRTHSRNPANFCRTEVYAGTPLYKQLAEQKRLKGSYWGHGYDMTDARAQLAFELMHATMFDRHHPQENLHHLTMGVDYELKLAARFFGVSKGMRSRVKGFIEEVNRNSCDYLNELLDAAESGFASESARRAFEQELKRRVDRGSWALTSKGQGILSDIRRSVDSSRRTTKWLRRAAAVGLVTAAASARGEGPMTQICESAPFPEPGQLENKKKPAPERTSEGILPDGDPKLVAAEFYAGMLEPLALGMRPARDLQVEMVVDKDGSIRLLELRKPDVDLSIVAKLTEDQKAAAKGYIEQMGADDFKQREEATASLEKLGRGVAPMLREIIADSKDPEVVTRCKKVLAKVEGLLDFEGRSALIRKMSEHVFGEDDQKGKRYVLKVKASELELIWFRHNRPTHIFEMAPGPRD